MLLLFLIALLFLYSGGGWQLLPCFLFPVCVMIDIADASSSAGWVPNSFSVPTDCLFAAVCVLGYWLLRGGANWRRGCVLDHMIVE